MKIFIGRGKAIFSQHEFLLSLFNIYLAHPCPLVHLWTLRKVSSVFTSLTWFYKIWIIFFAILCKTEPHCLHVPGGLLWCSVEENLFSPLHGSWSSSTETHRVFLLLCSTAFQRNIYLLIFPKILFTCMSRMTGPYSETAF